MPQPRRSHGLLSALLVLIVFAGVCFPPLISAQGDRRDQGRSTYSLSATVLIDPQGTAYFSNPEGAITAIKLDSGAQIWTTPKGKVYRPLAVTGKFLVAQQEGGETRAGKHFGIAYLQLLDGSEHLVTRVELPSSAWTSIKDGLGSSLRAIVTTGANDKVTIAWISERHPEVRGIAPDDEDQEPVQRAKTQVESHSGAVDIDSSGRVLPPGRPIASPQLFQTARQDLPEDQRLKGLPEAQFISADRKHVLVSEMAGDDRDLNKYQWTIYSGATREPMGTIASPFPTAPFFVSGSTLIYQLRPFMVREPGDKLVRSSLKLVAVDLRTGSKLWEHPVLDVEYYGPFPP
jgi:hypothetical protein